LQLFPQTKRETNDDRQREYEAKLQQHDAQMAAAREVLAQVRGFVFDVELLICCGLEFGVPQAFGTGDSCLLSPSCITHFLCSALVMTLFLLLSSCETPLSFCCRLQAEARLAEASGRKEGMRDAIAAKDQEVMQLKHR
jgi:hypothetical protein